LTTTNTWQLWGEIVINDPPPTGDLYVRVEGGSSWVASAPFDTLAAFVIDGLYADGTARIIEAEFSDAAGCADSSSVNAPLTSSGLLFDLGYALPNLSYDDSPLANARETLDMTGPGGAFGNIPSGTFDLDATSANPARVLSGHAAFCTELSQSISPGTTYDSAPTSEQFIVRPLETAPSVVGGTSQGQLIPAGGIGRVKAGMVRWLFDNHYQGIAISDWTNAEGSAFQAAMWDITHDHYQDNVSQTIIGGTNATNPYRVLNTPPGRALGESYLQAINALNWSDAQWESYESRNWHVVYLDSGSVQDQVFGIPLTKSPDLGDLPAGYPTTIASNGARHDFDPDDAHLGPLGPDSEGNGQPTATAEGDDTGGGNDEDGVEIWSNWIATPDAGSAVDQTLWFRVTIGTPGFVSLYVDFDSGTPSALVQPTITNVQGPVAIATGPFGDVQFPQAGVYLVAINVPANQAGATMATRWRITNQAGQGGNSAIGLASTGEIEDYIFDNDDTGVPVSLASFSSSRSGSRLEVQWSTASELGNVGFMLYGEDSRGEWRALLPEIQPSAVVDSDAPQFYSASVSARGIERLFLEDTDINGKAKLHGPFVVGTAHGQPPEAREIDWASIRRAHRQAQAHRLASAPTLDQAGVRLLVDRDAIYRVGFDDLAAMGLVSEPIPASSLALEAGGEPVEFHVTGASRAQFGPGAEIEFLGRAHRSLYSDTNVYRLSQHDRHVSLKTARVESKRARRAEPDWQNATKWGLATVRIARDRVYNFASPSGTPWADTRMVVTGSARQWYIDFDLEGLARGIDAGYLTLSLSGVTDWPGVSPDHHVEVWLNGRQVSEEWFNGQVQRRVTLPMSSLALQETGNRLTLRLPADTGAGADVVNLDHLEVHYPRRLEADDDGLRFRGRAEVFRVEGLSRPDASVYRVIDGHAERVENVKVEGRGPYTALIPGASSVGDYWIQPGDEHPLPVIEPGRLHDNIARGRADYLMIAHPDFIDGLAPLVDHHRAQGRQVRVVDLHAIYDRFSHGRVDAAAIQAYIRSTADRMGYDHVLLVGGDSRDYRNSLGSDSISFVPSLYTTTGSLVQFAPSDALLVDLDADGVPDLPIGRLPVRTPAELAAVIEKTLDYANRPIERTGVIAADRQEPGLSFSAQAQGLVVELGADWSIAPAFVDQLDIAGARSELIGAINAGVALTAYVGHSAATTWSFDGLLTSGDIGNLVNSGWPTVVAQWGCWNTYHVGERYDTLGHRFVLSPDRGAALAMGSATFTQVDSGRRFGRFLMPLLADPEQRTVGEALTEAKRRLAEQGGGDTRDIVLGWTILGDPALELR
jgi:hypothetical protein